MDYKLQMARLLAIFGVHLSIFFLCGLLLCILPWVIYFMFGVVWVLGFFVISICTELLGGEFEYEQHVAINCFWNIWVALKRAYGGSKTHPDWLATEEAAAVEAVLWW